MSEAGDYSPGPWKGHSFASARRDYDVHVGRSYDDAKDDSVDASSLVPNRLESKSSSPVVIVCDVTASMGDWPATIFSKLPYLDLEGKEYLGEDMEISFCAVGDQFSDNYPLQVQDFCTGTDMKDALTSLIIEGGGGGQTNESYDLPAAYYAFNCEIPNAVKPILIFIGDEGLYDFIDKSGAEKWAQTNVDGRMTPKTLFETLKQKWAVYLVRKPYGSYSESSGGDSTNRRIQGQWEELLGEDHVSMLPDAGRVVDVIFGIFAKETNRLEYFEDELKDRQRPDQVDVVLKSLHTIHKLPNPSVKKLEDHGASMTRRSNSDKSKRSVSLLDDDDE